MDKLEKELKRIYQAILAKEPAISQVAKSVHPDYQISARNLYQYLILRSFDLRQIHDGLSEFGISSLRSAESYVWKNLTNALQMINLLQGRTWRPTPAVESLGYQQSRKLLTRNTNQLFNATHKNHTTEIMVTMPTRASEDLELVRDLILSGMEVARINLGRDNLSIWKKIVENLRTLSQELHSPIKIQMDLAGPKIKTTEIAIPTDGQSNKGIVDFINIKNGEHLILTRRPTKGKQAIYKGNNQLVEFSEVGITLSQIITDLEIGDPVFFDDGQIEGKVLSKNKDDIKLVITKAHNNKLRAGKGINLPETHLTMSSLTEQDVANLPFVLENADILGFPFVRSPEDVQKLYRTLAALGNKDIGIVFKIENKEAFENLALILFEAMKRPKFGVMIARGDLAVELGYERISEVQQQILWFCEAAHIPVIWATQVLESLVQTGVASRAEVSDASLGAQAECAMLNDGPFIVEAVQMLKQILVRMESHGYKKKPMMRALNVAKLKLEKLTIV